MKKIIMLGMVLMTSLVVLTGCDGKDKDNKDKTADETKVNTSQDVIKDQSVDVFKFENTSLIYANNTSTLETKVTNTSSETQYLSEFKIHVKDAQGNDIIVLTGYIGSSIGPNESRVISSNYGSDLTKAASITYELIK